MSHVWLVSAHAAPAKLEQQVNAASLHTLMADAARTAAAAGHAAHEKEEEDSTFSANQLGCKDVPELYVSWSKTSILSGFHELTCPDQREEPPQTWSPCH